MAKMRSQVVQRVGATLLAACASCSGAKQPGAQYYTGYVEAELVYVASPVAGWLEDLHVNKGQAVEVGQLLFSLESAAADARHRATEAQIARARAEFADRSKGARPTEIAALRAELASRRAVQKLAREEYDRTSKLAAAGVATVEQLEQRQAAYETATAQVRELGSRIEVARLPSRQGQLAAAEASVELAEAARAEADWELSQYENRARVKGTVEDSFFRKGEFITSGAIVVALEEDGARKVRFFVPQRDLPALSLGKKVSVRVSDGAKEPATIEHIAHEAEFTPPVIYSEDSREKLVFLVEARLAPKTRLRPGLPVSVLRP